VAKAPPRTAAEGEVQVTSVRGSRTDYGADIVVEGSGVMNTRVFELQNPLRVVIEIRGGTLAKNARLVRINTEEIKGVRLGMDRDPALARVVVDLMTPMSRELVTTGNRLVLKLRNPAKLAAKAPAGPKAQPSAPRPAEVAPPPSGKPGSTVAVIGPGSPGVLVKGAVSLFGDSTRVTSGSSVTATEATASLRLTRGGEINLCKGTTISLTTSLSGRDLMLGLSNGSLETHYPLATSADTILTPDFRVLLTGPGAFHYAISSDARGNTCVRALRSNTASVTVSELMGDGSYQVKPSEQVVFHDGRVASHDTLVPAECGCPAAPRALVAETPRPAPPAHAPEQIVIGGKAPEMASVTPLPPPPKANELHVQIEAPFVFSAAVPPPQLASSVAHLHVTPVPLPQLVPLPPAQQRKLVPVPIATAGNSPPQTPAKPQQKRGFFSRLRSFLSGAFR
jgi:hypothetical protein